MGEPMREQAVTSVEISTVGGVLVLVGDVDVRCTGEVRAAIHDHLRTGGAGSDRVVVDVSGVTSVDATALRVLAVAARRARAHGLQVVLRGACPAVRRMLHLTHLVRLFELERVAVRA